MNSFGTLFRVKLFGESHGPVIGVVIDGIPTGIELSEELFQESLNRRRGGREGGTERVERDKLTFLSGLYNGYTTGSPLTIVVENSDIKSEDYLPFADTPRPGHADFVAIKKYRGFADPKGGGHFSGRVTVALVLAGVVANKIVESLTLSQPISIDASVISVGGEREWQPLLEEAKKRGDSLGGVVECRVDGVPIGLGSPFFNSIESLLSHIMFAIPGVRGVEFGDGFGATEMWGSEHNDPIISIDGETLRNGSGGVNGGITNGNQLHFKVAFKPTSSIAMAQESINLKSGNVESLTVKGRHDTAFVLRTPVIVEAATAILLADLLLMQ